MTLRQKILLLSLLSVAGMFLALWLQYRSFVTQSHSIDAVAHNIRAVSALSHTTHQLQKERGLTAIAQFNANDQALSEQVRQTDAMLSRLAGAGVLMAGFDESLGRLRAMVAAGATEQLTIRDSYNDLLQRLIDEMNRLIREPAITIARADISAHTHVVSAKEYLGQIRATLGYWIEHKRDDPPVLNSLIRLKSLHTEELRKFGLEASPMLYKVFNAQFSGLEVEQTLATVAQITATGRLPQTIDVKTWWSMATAAIDRLNVIEEQSLESINKDAEAELAQLHNAMRLGVITTLAIGLTALILIVSATTTLLRALDNLLASIEQIASSQDFHNRIPVGSPDEIGRITRSFNQLLDIVERLLNEKDYLAITDPLTGINNRLRFTKVLSEEAERKRRSKTPMALVMFDIDHFKHINDTYGHNIGDEALKTLATLVSKEIRATDFFGRWGGEEFVLLLRDDGCDAALVTAEKLRNLIAIAEFPGTGKLTCSFGVAAWDASDSEASLVARADKALYTSKNDGRNRTSCEHGDPDSCPGRTNCAQRVENSLPDTT